MAVFMMTKRSIVVATVVTALAIAVSVVTAESKGPTDGPLFPGEKASAEFTRTVLGPPTQVGRFQWEPIFYTYSNGTSCWELEASETLSGRVVGSVGGCDDKETLRLEAGNLVFGNGDPVGESAGRQAFRAPDGQLEYFSVAAAIVGNKCQGCVLRGSLGDGRRMQHAPVKGLAIVVSQGKTAFERLEVIDSSGETRFDGDYDIPVAEPSPVGP